MLSWKRSTLAALTAAAALLTVPPLAAARPDHADALETFSRDVFVVLGASLRNPDIDTPSSDELYNVAGLNLGVTWGQWQGARATSRVSQTGGTSSPRSRVRIDLTGLVPGGVYSIFYATIGPDTVNPKCPGVERMLPLNATRPAATAPDASSFIADPTGATRFRATVAASLLEADQLFFTVIYHADGMTYGDLPNRGEFLTQGPECRSSFGHDAMRQLLILQQW